MHWMNQGQFWPLLLSTGPQPDFLTYHCQEDLTVNGQRISGTLRVTAHYALAEQQIAPAPLSDHAVDN